MLEERDAEELVLVLAGYFTLATELDLSVTHVKSVSDEQCEYYLLTEYGAFVWFLTKNHCQVICRSNLIPNLMMPCCFSLSCLEMFLSPVLYNVPRRPRLTFSK